MQARTKATAANPSTVADSMPVNIQAGGQVTLFGLPFYGIYDSQTGIFVIKQKNDGNEPRSVNIKKIAEDIGNMVQKLTGKPSDSPVQITLPAEFDAIAEKIDIVINELYFKLKTKENNAIEFALWIGIETDLGNIFPVTFDKLYLKVWKTNNKKVLESMNIAQVQALLLEDKTAQ